MIQGLIPYSGFSHEIIKHYYSPNLVFKNSGQEFLNLYCFISRIQPWNDENNPPAPENSDFYNKTAFKNIIAIKKIETADISPVIERNDWISGSYYNAYSSNENLADVDEVSEQSGVDYDYYVRNSYDQVFKCLANGTTPNSANGSPSLIQPIIDFSTNSVDDVIVTGDGYKWKYMYTIDAGSKLKFFDDYWMPVPIASNRSSISSNKVGAGEISVINVYTGGTGYTNDNGFGVTTNVTITGDGINANAVAIISGGSVTDILMTNTGSGYTYATANISPTFGYSGNGAILKAETSPIGGHGHDILKELGCRDVMITASFNNTESGVLPTDIDYRQIGLLANPEITIGSSTQFANSVIYKSTHDITVSPGSGNYSQDEIVYQGTIDNPTFTGMVLKFDSVNNILYLINTLGNIGINQPLYGSQSNAFRLAINSVVEQYVPYSGTIIYIENRPKVQRSSTGSEQFRLTLNY